MDFTEINSDFENHDESFVYEFAEQKYACFYPENRRRRTMNESKISINICAHDEFWS